MDRTETYIKQCEKAEEIQDSVRQYIIVEKAKVGWLRTSAVGEVINTIDHNGEVFIFSDATWLPTQAQLQEMVPTKFGSTRPNFKMISELNHFFDYWDTNGIPYFLSTWEQLWLAFVMKEKYNKVWNGDDWIKEIGNERTTNTL